MSAHPRTRRRPVKAPVQTPDALRHRRFLSDAVDVRPFRGTDILLRIGGESAVDRLIDGLYDRIEKDPELRPLFTSDLTPERVRQKLFFAEWLGGERRYGAVAYGSLKHKHDAVPITRALAGRWLGHFRRSLEEAVTDDGDRQAILRKAEAFAFALVNQEKLTATQQEKLGARRYLPQGSSRTATCGLGSREHPRNRATGLARRGNVAGLVALLKEQPGTLRLATHAAVVLQTAVLAGKLEVVELLVKHGVDVDKPAVLPQSLIPEAALAVERVLFVTPLCAARLKRQAQIEGFLRKKGAKNDVFTAAFLGDVSELCAMLAADPTLAQAPDPAGDILDITPIHHAIAGAQLEALRALLEHVDPPLVAGERALRGAAEQESLAMVELLLAKGVDATSVGAGRWVLHPEMAPVLARAGARVDSSGSWIGLCCTGNQGRKDDPEYVRALLRHGARVDDKRLVGQDNDGGRATALHYAAKAGFLKTIVVLLEHGADPNVLDDNGLTPLDWVERAAKSVDREKVRRLLRRSRAS